MRKLIEKKLVIASHNANKIHEMYNLIMPLGIMTTSSLELNLIIPEETGKSFEENAMIKSLSAAINTGIPALADDSGLVVDALDGDPGIYSARWAERNNGERDFEMAMQKIENALISKSANDSASRSAHFISVLSLAWPDGHVENFIGKVQGIIVWPPRGQLGFGYDPIFQPNGYDRTFGEMTEKEKNGSIGGMTHPILSDDMLSHRARAFKCFVNSCLCS
ncbi:RdgB/HAM1 family non-canonical purine NTP pyrophosphatase [Candidatus Liberibacter africanus]|uniref:dITP/XTP pyrophosphatase n=1 Tax=Candidatus Liberibacter africanus PTSAPSY TaxID=1277257 RepID=A0A0G3I6W5_LIBAF|nr:RdgB/HAM1 family non-canonical purine NTP pyrophosphatase [Candidatus Liberibacter africanus]AKK20278.1 putative deoxyribonucleotide triphosphate pyrophosphatase [Candidatus Liberibacter africanus PTSAPSY]QTP64039.1 RdgB/HAM1 family non-canonical purine NTP pyrophosphatase [Candidatus Liberibacter africanus]